MSRLMATYVDSFITDIIADHREVIALDQEDHETLVKVLKGRELESSLQVPNFHVCTECGSRVVAVRVRRASTARQLSSLVPIVELENTLPSTSDLKKAGEAAAEIRSEVEGLEKVGEIVVVQLDLSSLQSIRECAGHILKTEKMVHILVNNAGVCYCPKGYTRDGFELHIGINHLGHFLFTCLLLPRIIRSAPARIVTVSSYKGNVAQGIYLDDLHWEKRPYNPFEAYSESKLANVLFSTELSRRLEGKGVTTYAVHPGVVATDAGRYADMSFFPGARWLFENVLVYIIKTPEQGAQTTIHCAV
ncbi:hypothetical protein C0J52_03373 [Blattella germanica]|nr:hypothetical protein C0J52_03373 [Blattella germanica]